MISEIAKAHRIALFEQEDEQLLVELIVDGVLAENVNHGIDENFKVRASPIRRHFIRQASDL